MSHEQNRKKMELYWFFPLHFRKAYDSTHASDFQEFSLNRESEYHSVATEKQPEGLYRWTLTPKVASRYVIFSFNSGE